VAGLVLVASMMASPARAIDWEKMVMPGPLISGHAKLEKNCAACHQAFDVSAQRQLCLTCHEDVAADLTAQVGFHSRNPLASSGPCKACHPDHLGRDANILGSSDATFDHSQTDFPLRGRHETVDCIGCHPADARRRDAPTACVDCHRKNDPHHGSLGSDCAKCHDEVQWRTTRFDHAKTRFPLTGAHATASCEGCHVGGKYRDVKQDCLSCHAIDDAHGGRFGPKCADCHNTQTWKKKGFDHEKEAKFALTGAHGRAACTTCHRVPPGQRKLPKSCAGCHATEDIHAGRFGDDCGTCHAPTTWKKVAFDHERKSRFPLRGAHARADCNTCHVKPVSQGKLPLDCYGCHRADDVHKQNLGRDCAECHNEDSFSGRVLFDHELTKFPLLGLHGIAPCESCHRDSVYAIKDTSCRACHAADDVHKKTLGTACETCHNPNGWALWRFDHDQETRFALVGKHAGLECSACHTTPMNARNGTSTECVACHTADDVHKGEFGRRCEGCHSAAAWKPTTFDRRSGVKP
jgi:hypothetical protein